MADVILGRIKGEVTLESEDFRKGMTEVSNRLRLAKSEFDSSAAKVKAFGKSQDALKAQAQALNQQLDLQEKKVALLNKAYQDSIAKTGEHSKQSQRLATQLNKANTSMIQMQGALQRTSQELERGAQTGKRFNRNMFEIQEQAAETGMALGLMTAALAVALGSAVKKAADFESQLSSVKAVTGSSADEMDRFRQLALDMGSKTKYSALEAAQGIEELAKAGISTTQILNGGLQGALDLAAAGEIELADAAEIASTVLNAFRDDNLSVAQAANILAGAANASATDIGELKFGLSQVSAVASGVGLSFEDTASALAIFAQNGLKGSDAGTSLKTMLLNLTPSSKEAREEMMDLGIITKEGANQFFDAQGHVKSFADISGILRKQLGHLSDEQRSQALKTMFGTDAIRAANIAFKEGAAGVSKMSQEMSKTTAAEVAATRMDNLKGTVEQLKGAFETFQIQMGSAFLPTLRSLVSGISEVVDWFSQLSPSTQQAIGTFIAVTAGTLALGAAIAGIIAIANPFTAAVVGAGVVLGGLSAITQKTSQDLKMTEENAVRFGKGVSKGTIEAAKGYMDLRDRALVNLAQLRTATGSEARKIVEETATIFAQMGDKITAALNQDKVNVQKAAAGLLQDVPKVLEPGIQKITDTAIKSIDAQLKRVQNANKTIRQGLVQYGGDVAKMPKQFAASYNQALKDLDQTSQTFVKKIGDMKGYMENITADQGKVTAAGARKWVKDIEAAYKQATSAAKKWSGEQKKVWEEQFANGNITKQQYDQVLKIVEQGEKEKIQIAKNSRAEAIKSLEKSLSDEANMYDLKTGEMLDRYSDVKKEFALVATDEQLAKVGRERNRKYFDSLIQDTEKSAAEVKKRQQVLIRAYGDMGTSSVQQLVTNLQKGGNKARLAAQALAVNTRDGFKIDLGEQGVISVDSFVKGLQTGQYKARDVSIASMNQLRAVYGSGSFTAEGIKAVETFANGLRSQKPAEIAAKLGLDLKSKMTIDLGPYGQMTAQSFAQGLSNGSLGFDAIYTYFRSRIKTGMKVDLSPEGQQNLETLRLGMQSKAIDVQEAAAALGLNIKSNAKVDLGAEGQQTVQSLLAGLQSGKVDVETFAKGIAALVKTNAKANLSPEGKQTGQSYASGLGSTKGQSQGQAQSMKTGVQKQLGSTTDGGGGKKAGSQFSSGVSSQRGAAGSAAGAVAGAVKSNLKVSGASGLGSNVASSFASGIRSGIGGVASAAISLARSAYEGMKRALDINSPSRVMMGIGASVGEGLSMGIKNSTSQVASEATQLAKAAIVQPSAQTFSTPTGMASNEARMNTVFTPASIVINFNGDNMMPQNKQQVRTLARDLGQAISEELARKQIIQARSTGVRVYGPS